MFPANFVTADLTAEIEPEIRKSLCLLSANSSYVHRLINVMIKFCANQHRQTFICSQRITTGALTCEICCAMSPFMSLFYIVKYCTQSMCILILASVVLLL